jgi:hypothetical protein
VRKHTLDYKGMLTLETCKKMLNDGSKKKYSDDEVKLLRETLYWFAELQLESEYYFFNN